MTGPACARCGKPLMTGGPGRPRRFCTDACKQAAYRARLTTRQAAAATLAAWAALARDTEREDVQQ